MNVAGILAIARAPLVTDHTWIFFLVLVIILFAPLLLRRLHIPPIIGLILAGILVGEHGFNILERDSSFELFGQVGIYYIMFLAGLELDMGSVQQYGKHGLLFGLLTFCIPFVLGYLVCRRCLDYGILTSLLMSSIFSSHTLVSYPIVGRYGLGRHRTVVVSVVATAFATFAALLVVALVSGSMNPHASYITWIWFALKCIAYGTAVVLIFPRLGRWFLRRYNDSVMQYIFILALVFLSAALAELAGLEGLLGAFLAGLTVNRLIPHTSPLMTRIEFIGNALFIPYFLIGVGMIINVSILLESLDTLRIIAIMVVVGTLTKWLASWITAHILHLNKHSMWLMFGLTNAHAAGALAIVMIGTAPEVGLMDSVIMNGAVMLILFSCIISSFATNYGAKQLALEDTTLEENRGSYHGKCLIAYSQEDNVDVMTQWAILIRNPYIADSLMGLSVTYDNEIGENRHKKDRMLLEKAKSIAASADVNMKTLSRMSTNISGGILRTMKEYEVGEVILCLTDRETGMAKASLGNVIDNVLSGSHREVMAIRAIAPPGTLRQVVVVVPQKAEYEVGFYKWLEHLCRIGEQTGCKMEFHAHPDTLKYIPGYMEQKHPQVRVTYEPMPKWNDLKKLYGKLGADQMLVVVSARPGFISHSTVLDLLPQQIHKYFWQTSVVLLFPDQWGDPLDTVSVFAPNGTAVTRQSHTLGAWIKNKLFRTTSVLAMFFCLTNATAQAPQWKKMSPFVRQAALTQHVAPQRTKGISDTEHSICALLRITDTEVAKEHHARILAQWGNICIADIPLNQLNRLASRPEVVRIEAKRPGCTTMDTTGIITRFAPLHNAQINQTPFTGKGVIMGVMDVGFDLTHPNFYTPDLSEYRIKAFWDQLDLTTEGNGDSMFVGQEYITEEAILKKKHSSDAHLTAHGTHTSGIAAGSGYDSPYIGAAPEAELCLVSNAVVTDLPIIPEENLYKYTSATDLLGFKYIFDYARQQGKPCVISFSEGGYQDLYGDDQMVYEVLDSLVGPGRIICASAGNQSIHLTHLQKPLGEKRAAALLELTDKSGFYQLKADKLANFCLEFFFGEECVYEKEICTKDILTLPDSILSDTLSIADRTFQLLVATYPSCYNANEWATELYLKDLTEGNPKPTCHPALTLKGEDANIEAYASGGYFLHVDYLPLYADATATHNINTPASAPSVICVGSSAYRTGIQNYKQEWVEFDFGEGGEIGRHSSIGPTMCGLTKPEVIAPGVNVISSYSSYFMQHNPNDWNMQFDVRRFSFRGREYAWNAQSGTSMSSPIVGGILALWLQVCPSLTREQALEVIAKTSKQRNKNISYPNNTYGYGEIDAMAGVQYLLQNHAGVNDMQHEKPFRIARYDLSGRRIPLNAPYRGIYIEAYSDGSVQKRID